MTRRGAASRLTVQERILLHLAEHAPQETEYHMPVEVTQTGLAEAVGVDQKHVPQYVRPMIADGLVEERTAHIESGRQRRKAYFLGPQGRREAARLREQVKAAVVRVRDAAGIRETTFSDALREAGGKASLLDLVRQSQETGALDLAGLVSPPATRFIAMLSAAPRLGAFMGRRKELEAVTGEAMGPRIFVVRGVAGIGKSSLGAKACEVLRGKRNLYWHRVRPWDTNLSILASLGEFLSALGRPGLRSVLSRGETSRAAEVVKEDLPGTQSFLAYDDVHEASKETLAAFRVIKEAVAGAEDVTALILTRRSLSFYDRREVALQGLVREIDLEGLESSAVAALLKADGREPELAKLGRRFAGHPLFLELLFSSSSSLSIRSRLTSVQQFIEEEIYTDLSEPERKMMKLAALYRAPVPSQAFYAEPSLTHDILVALRERAFVRQVGEDVFELHDTIRDYFDSILSTGEKTAIADFAVGQLRNLASYAESTSDYLAVIDYLSNALQLVSSKEERTVVLEALGDAYQSIGDLPETMNAYKEGLAWAKDPETIARLHRKTAAALVVRGDAGPASKEIDKAFQVLGDARSVERGWLELLRAKIASSDPKDRDRALSCVRAALEVFRERGEKHGEAEALLVLGFITIHEPEEGDLAQGEKFLQAGLDLATWLQDRKLVSEAHGDLAHFYTLHKTDVGRVMGHLDAQESAASDQDYATRSLAVWWRAIAQKELLADFAAAEANLHQVVALARRTYDSEGSYLARHALAEVTYYRGEFAEARQRNEELWQESQAAGWFEFSFALKSLWTAAECCLWQGDREGFERLVAELDRPGVRERLIDRMVIMDVLRGLSAFIRGDEVKFESFFSHGLSGAERAFKAQEAPVQFRSFLVPYFYGIALRARPRR